MISFFNKFLRRNRITGLDFLPTPTVGGVGVDIPDAKFFKSITSEVKNQYAHAFKQTQKYFFLGSSSFLSV